MSTPIDSGAALVSQIAEAEHLLQERELRKSLQAFNIAEEMGADADGCAAARWMISMLLGDFEGGWGESDAIRRRGGADPHRFWMQEDTGGRRVIVRCLHGFGDAIQFLRYLPQLKALASEVILEVPPRMADFARWIDGADVVITWGEMAPARSPEWDVQVEVMELPYMFRTTVPELPITVEYLRVPADEVERAGRLMGAGEPGFRVGVVWAAGVWNTDRSIPPPCIEELLRSGCAEFWTLQGGDEAAQAKGWTEAGLVRDAAICGDGLTAMAAAVANLDLVITVDTLAAHMAGAMGKPVWVLLQHAADWRWMTDRTDSPWYPTMRLFRQRRQGDWSGLIEEVRAEVRAELERRSESVRVGDGVRVVEV